MLSSKVADRLSAYETPFYFYDMSLLRQTLDTVTKEASKYGYVLHYAIKANYDHRILEVINSYGLGIDCVSKGEMKTALDAGFPADRIVLAGVGKKDSEMEYAIDKNIFSINCESIEEMIVLDRIAAQKGKTVNVALRINPDIDPKTNHNIDTGHADTKFGIAYRDIVQKAEMIQSLQHLNVRGMHIHIGSQIRDMHVFEQLARKVNGLVKDLTALGFKFEFVDLGGGLGVYYDQPELEPVPDFEGMFKAVAGTIDVGGLPVHFEFGRSIVAQCGELITRVLFNKTTATGKKYVIVDSSMTELIRPALYGAYHNIENITSISESTDKYTVAGTACESTDIFDDSIDLRITRRGDLLTLKSAGAYGSSMASTYNCHPMPASVYSDDLK